MVLLLLKRTSFVNLLQVLVVLDRVLLLEEVLLLQRSSIWVLFLNLV